jgi:replicative DNA helicase
MQNLPHSQEAEQSVLGCILSKESLIADIAHTLTEADFYNPAHKEIYKIMLKLYNDSKAIDVITVSNEGADIEYLTNLADIVPTTENIKQYISILKGKSLRRQYVTAGQKIVDMAINGQYDNMTDFKNDVLSAVDIDVKDNKEQENNIKQLVPKVIEGLDKRYNEKETSYKKYGYYWIDKWTSGVRLGLTYLAARPSVGKTAFSLNILDHLASQGMKVAMFNLEMEKEQLVERMLSIRTKLQYEKVLKPWSMNENDWVKVAESGQLAAHDIYIYDTIFKIEEIKSICRELKSKGQLDYVIVDYLQLCETMKKCSGPNDRVSHISRQFKIMQKELKVPFLVLSQLNRANEHDNRRPKLTDLRDSGSLEQDADNVFFLHDPKAGEYESANEEAPQEVEFIIAKQRSGRRDIFTTLKFHKQTQIFSE